jgi:MFS family permease
MGMPLGSCLVAMAVAGLVTLMVARRLTPDAPPRRREGRHFRGLAVGLMLAGATAVFIEAAPFDWGAIFLTDVTGASGAVAGAGVILFTAGLLAGRLAGDHLVDRFGNAPVLFSGLAVSVIAMLVVVATGLKATALVGFGVCGLGISVALPVLYKLAGSHRSFAEGSGLAALTVGTRLGFMVASALIGVAATSWRLPTALAVVIGAAAGASMIAIRLTLVTPVPAHDSVPETGVS